MVDKDAARIRRWNSPHLPIYEPGLRDVVRLARDGGRGFSFSNEPSPLLSSSASSDGDILGGVADVSTSSSECGSQCDFGSGGCHHGGASGIAGPVQTVPARQPNLFFTTSVSKCISEADIVLIAVNTPTKRRGAGAGNATDMTAFEAVTAEVAVHARPGAIIVEKSTVPCRTAQMVKDTVRGKATWPTGMGCEPGRVLTGDTQLATYRKGVHFEILSNPEFLAAGTAMNDLLFPDRVLIGCSPTPSGRRAAESLASVYASWVPRSRIITTNVFSSELAKLVANSMLAQRISSINSIAAVCEATGADVDEVAAAIGCDPRIGDRFLKAGIGFGGSCFKKDILSLVYLAESLGLDQVGAYWRAVVDMNVYARDRFARRVIACLNNTLVGKKLTLLGYAFKNNTDDTRETPALEIIRTLLDEGPREVAVYDPCCNPVLVREELRHMLRNHAPVLWEEGGPVIVYVSPYDACRDADAVLITTEWDEFRNTPSSQSAGSAGTNGTVNPQRDSAHDQQELQKPRHIDPRPFARLEPTESELLSLHRYLVATGGGPDPLQRFEAEPSCASDCPDCAVAAKTATPVSALTGYAPSPSPSQPQHQQRLDWSRVAYHLLEPKWVFDGKGVIDIGEMDKLGIRVESVGRQRR